jgi:hypothetical protein
MREEILRAPFTHHRVERRSKYNPKKGGSYG